MNTQTRFYDKGLSQEEINEIFLQRRIACGDMYGFDGHKMFMADQEKKDGSSFLITEEYVRDNPNGWTDIPEDILIIKEDLPGVVIGYPVADCPIVMMEDPVKGFSAIAHCSAEMIDKKLPMMLADALVEACGSRDEDIQTYISVCAESGWTYDSFPKWVADAKVWEEAIYQGDDGLFHIDLRKAIKKQLRERNVDFSACYK